MQVTIDVSEGFESKLAELAWGDADDITKRTIRGAVASRILTSESLLAGVMRSIVKEVERSLVDEIRAAPAIEKAKQKVLGEIAGKIKTDAKDLSRAILAEVIQKQADKHVKECNVGSFVKSSELSREVSVQVHKYVTKCVMAYMECLDLTKLSKETLLSLLQKTYDEVQLATPVPPNKSLKKGKKP